MEEKHWINPRGGYGGVGTKELSLQERKNILVGFLSQSTEPVKENSSLEWKYSKQKEWAKGTTGSASNSFLSSKLSRVSGLFESGGSKILKDSEGNSYLVHLIHVRYDDLKDMNSWKALLKDIGPDLLAHELVKLAGERTLQNQVVYHLLNETKANETKANEGISKLTIGDSRLREKMGVM